MKHYLELVPISARVHQRQNRLSVFCIALAVFLVTTIFGMADMFIRSQILQAQIEEGSFHISIKDITDEEAMLISMRPEIRAAARYGVLNYRGDRGYTFEDKQAIIVGCDEEYVTELETGIIEEGNFPQKDGEVMVTKSAKEYFGLQVGDEVAISRPNDTELRYTISGFCSNAAKTMSEDAYGFFITTAAFREIYPGGKGDSLTDYKSVLMIQFSDMHQIQKAISTLKEECNLSDEQVRENTKLLGLLGRSRNSFMVQIYMSALILFVLVLAAGSMMIAGSLTSNVAGRTEFFGLMRCIGATPKQVMRFVRKEAIRWCRFAIPAGVAAGVVIIWVLCAILRSLSPEYFGTMPSFSVSVPSIIAGIAVGLLTVLLAARSPARRAAKVSPLEAVSGNASDLQPVRRAANTKLFKVETALGIHHAGSGRKNFILMVLSFSLSIILFLSFSVAIVLANHALTPLRPWSADISIISPDNTCSVSSALLEDLKENPAVTAAYGRMFDYDVPAAVNGSAASIDLISYEEKQFGWAEDYLLEGSLETVQEETNTGLVVYGTNSTMKVGDILSLDIAGKPAEIKIAGILSDCPFHNENDGIIICSENTFRQITGERDYTIIDLQLDKKATDEEVNAIHQMAGNELFFSDERMGNAGTRGFYYCTWLFLYGFLVLIAFITIFNIINSIALSVSARTRQYGAFRAIGLSTRQLSKMVIAEAVTYTVSGTAVGIVSGLLFHKMLFEMMITYRWGDTWSVPWIQLGISVWIMLLSILLAVYKPIKNLSGMSIVDNISAQ